MCTEAGFTFDAIQCFVSRNPAKHSPTYEPASSLLGRIIDIDISIEIDRTTDRDIDRGKLMS